MVQIHLYTKKAHMLFRSAIFTMKPVIVFRVEVEEITAVDDWQSVLPHNLFEELHETESKFPLHWELH